MDTITNLWTGRAGLARTYWGWGILGGFLWGIAISFVIPGSPPAILLMMAFAAYFTLVSTGTWRAATLYQGKAVWARLAKVAAAFGFVTIAVILLGFAFVAKTFVIEGRLPTPVHAGKAGTPIAAPAPPQAGPTQPPGAENPFKDPNYGKELLQKRQ